MLQGRIPRNPHNEAYMKDVRLAANQALEQPDTCLPYTAFQLYEEIGDRPGYENHYILHRKRAGLFLLMALWEDDDRWLRALTNTLWAILDEFTWALPAHLFKIPWEKKPYRVDLFSAETSFLLSEADALLQERLPDPVRARIRHEIRRRVLAPFFANEIQFPESNWAAVQISGVIAPLCAFGTEEEMNRALPGIDFAYQRFFASFQEDGCCLEGALYWMFGFGYFCYGAQLLRERTGGRVNYFNREKVRSIALFYPNISLGGSAVIPYSDGPHHLHVHFGLFHFLCREYPQFSAPAPETEMRYGEDERYRLPDILRDLYWYDPDIAPAARPAARVDYPASQWFVRRGAPTFVIKGGDNREPHNHNDLGSFIVRDGEDFIIDDPGWAEYDREYFSQKRYSHICASSRGHSVPLVDGREQITTPEGARCRVLAASDDEVSLDIGCGYGDMALVRTVRRAEGAISLSDAVSGNHTLAQRIATRICPQILGEKARVRDYALSCDCPCHVRVTKETFIPRLIFHNGDAFEEETLYLIDFIPETPRAKMTLFIRKED